MKAIATCDVEPNGCVVTWEHPTRGVLKVTLELEPGQWPSGVVGEQLGPVVQWACQAPLPRP